MTHLIDAIRDSMRGGWENTSIFDFKFIEHGFIETVFGDFNDELAEREKLSLAEIFFDPNFWRCLGVARGWEMNKIRMCVGCGIALRWNEKPDMEGRHAGKNGCGSDIIEYSGQGFIEHHRFIDHLWENRTAEDFFRELSKY